MRIRLTNNVNYSNRLISRKTVSFAFTNDDILAALSRHVRGDWGNLDDHDRKENERALEKGCRLFSSYRSTMGVTFWIITEWDRSATTVLLPEDY